MKLAPEKRKQIASATLVQSLWLICACSVVFALTSYASDPTWWSSRGAVLAPVVTTNSGVVTTNYVQNDYAAVTQGQLKQFTARAVDELNANLSGGAGTNLNTMMSNWASDYATNGYNATNIEPSDYAAMNVGQLKYIGNKVWAQLVAGGYTNAVPSWLAQNTNTDGEVANLGQLKEIFDFALSTNSGTGTGMDTNGLAIAWEEEYFGQTGLDTNSSPDGNGFTLLQDYQGGANPTNYYSQPTTNGPVTIIPVVAITSGNNQSGPPSTFLTQALSITVTGPGSTPLTNAPVTFSVMGTNGGQFATSLDGMPTSSLTVTTDGTGVAGVFYSGTSLASTTNSIQASAGSINAIFNEVTQDNDGAVAAPSGVTATLGGSNGQMVLNWQNNATNATFLLVQQSVDNVNWATVATLTNAAATNCTVIESNLNQSYYFGIRAGKP